MTTTVPQAPTERSVPKPEFTDAEAGAKVFPDSTSRSYNYFVTTEAQTDPLRGRHRRGPARSATLPVAGVDLRFRRR